MVESAEKTDPTVEIKHNPGSIYLLIDADTASLGALADRLWERAKPILESAMLRVAETQAADSPPAGPGMLCPAGQVPILLSVPEETFSILSALAADKCAKISENEGLPNSHPCDLAASILVTGVRKLDALEHGFAGCSGPPADPAAQSASGQSNEDRLRSDIQRLADFIMSEVPGEPSQDQGAIDTAIRWMRERVSREPSRSGQQNPDAASGEYIAPPKASTPSGTAPGWG